MYKNRRLQILGKNKFLAGEIKRTNYLKSNEIYYNGNP